MFFSDKPRKIFDVFVSHVSLQYIFTYSLEISMSFPFQFSKFKEITLDTRELNTGLL